MSREKILIVTSDTAASRDLRAHLESLGYVVAGEASAAAQALALAEERAAQLVLIDIDLAGALDCVQTAQHIQKAKRLPVLFMTTTVDDVIVERIKACDSFGFVIKPIQIESLRASLEYAFLRRAIEEQAREGEARYRGLFDSSLDGIASADLQGNLLECNPAFCEISGYSNEELAGKSAGLLIPPETQPILLRFLADQGAHLEAYENLLTELIHKSGARIPISYRLLALKGSDNQTRGYWAIIRNNSRQQRAEQQINRQEFYAQQLIELTELLNRPYELAELYEVTCVELVRRMGLGVVSIGLLDPEANLIRHVIVHWSLASKFDLPRMRPYPVDIYRQFWNPDRPYVYFHDVRAMSMFPNQALLQELDIRSMIVIQLRFENRLIGMLHLGSLGAFREFNEEETQFMLAFGNQLVVAIERARLFDQLRRRVADLEMIGQLSTRLRSITKPKEMLPVLLNLTGQFMQADCGTICFLGPAGNLLEQIEYNDCPVSLGEIVTTNGTLWARALASQELVPLGAEYFPAAAGVEIGSALLLPLRSTHTLVGLIALGFFAPRVIDSGEIKILGSLAEMGGNALHRSGLMEALERRATDRSSELRTLYDLSVLFNSPAGFEEKLKGALTTALEIVNADRGGISSYDRERGRLSLEAHHNLTLETLLRVHEMKLDAALKEWLETSSVPWLVNRGDLQNSIMRISETSDYQSLINVPIHFEKETIGLLTIIWRRQVSISPDQIAFLIAVGERVGSVIQNERIRQKVEHAALLEERQRLGREFHDSVTQTVYGLTLLTEAARDLLAHNDLARLEGLLGELGATSLQALKEMRMLLFETRSTGLAGQGFVQALQTRLDLVERRSGVKSQIEVCGQIRLSPGDQETLYWIAIEALNNSLKHSGAKSIWVQIDASETGVSVRVRDDGQGFDPAQRGSAGLGLTSMRERVDQLGGTLLIQSTPGAGTSIGVDLHFEGESLDDRWNQGLNCR